MCRIEYIGLREKRCYNYNVVRKCEVSEMYFLMIVLFSIAILAPDVSITVLTNVWNIMKELSPLSILLLPCMAIYWIIKTIVFKW